MIRECQPSDFPTIQKIHFDNGLPENCLPDFTDPLILHKAVLEEDERIVMASFLKGISEVYLFVDHSAGTPEQRWQWLQELKEYMRERAWSMGLEQMSAWLPPEIEKSFGKRMEELGFVRSPWTCYTLNL